MYAIAFQMQCNCNAIASRLKVTIVTTIKKGLPGNPHIAHLHTIKKKEAGNGTKRKTKGWLTF